MNIRRGAPSRLSVNVWSQSLLAFALTSAWAGALVPACSSQVSVGHGQPDSAGTGGNHWTDHAGRGGSESTLPSAGSDVLGGSGAGLEQVGAQAGAAEASCMGPLEAVDRTLGPACPASLCEATAWAAASCSSSADVLSSSARYCGIRQLTEVSFELADGASKRCVYAVASSGALGADGALVGVALTDVTSRFCGKTSTTISAGQTRPADCAGTANSFCSRAETNGDAGASNGGDAGASNSGAPEAPIQACLDAFSGTCEPCCPATPPDCSDKPEGYPGYRCSVSSGSFCSCQCNRGQWLCGC